MLIVSNVSLSFGKRTLFKDVNLKFTPGNCYGVIGANGAGKSTFLKLLSKELDTTTGEIVLTDKERMSVLRQDHNAFDDKTVLETVIMGNKKLYDIMKEKEEIYSKPDFTDEDGLRNGLIKYLSGNSKLVRKDKRDKEVNIKQLASRVKKSEPEVKTAVEDVITNDEGDLIKSTAAQVLTKLGISEKQARNIVNDLYRPGMSSEEILNAYGIGKSTT